MEFAARAQYLIVLNLMQKDSKTALIFSGVALGMVILFFFLKGSSNAVMITNNATVANKNGTQIVSLTAKGGFTPSFIEAQAGVPTELHIITKGTYDCSSSLIIPSLSYQTMLKPTGTETIMLTSDQAQGTLEGMCGMGMYRFKIAFK
jgi:plastocyanin domain-containing protein